MGTAYKGRFAPGTDTTFNADPHRSTLVSQRIQAIRNASVVLGASPFHPFHPFPTSSSDLTNNSALSQTPKLSTFPSSDSATSSPLPFWSASLIRLSYPRPAPLDRRPIPKERPVCVATTKSWTATTRTTRSRKKPSSRSMSFLLFFRSTLDVNLVIFLLFARRLVPHRRHRLS